jgi:cytosine/adenosine deaminase-related metal-dependent hydrolase
MIHLAEGTDRLAESELSILDAVGCLADNTVLIHGVGITEAQVERVISAGASIVWCPSSNLRLLGRTFNPRRLFAARRLALGTDSRLSGTRDLLEEMRIAALHSDLTARELLSLVTSAAAAVLRMSDLGKVELRGPVDLIALRSNGGDPYEQLLASTRADLRAVVRGGLPVIADPDFADWFAAAAVNTEAINLDGRPKLLSATQIPAAMLEPGLTFVQPDVRS